MGFASLGSLFKVLLGKASHSTLGAVAGGHITSIGSSALVLTMSATAVVFTATGAVFTDTDAVASNAFSTGTVDLASLPASAVVSLSAMAPGDLVVAPLTVSNAGSLQLRYALTSQTTEDTLAAQLDSTIKSGVTTCTAAGFDTDGTVLYGPGDLGNSSGLAVIGDATQGHQSGDRLVNASANEVLCIKVALPVATGNTFQGESTTANLSFAAEQTANN